MSMKNQLFKGHLFKMKGRLFKDRLAKGRLPQRGLASTSLRCVMLLLSLMAIVAGCGDGEETSPPSEGEPSAGADQMVDLEGRQVTVAVENAYIPYSYINADTGQAEGWDYDMLAEICDRLNCEPVFKAMSWEGTLETVGSGDIDMAANGIVINSERQQIVDFADSYGSANQYLFARVGDERVMDMSDLADMDYTIAAQTNTVNYDKAVELVGFERVVTVAYLGEAIEAVANGEVDAFLHLLKDGQRLVGPYSDEVEIVGDPIEQLDYGFIFSKGSDLVEPFNAAIAAMKADGTFAEINDPYFSPSFSITTNDIVPQTYG